MGTIINIFGESHFHKDEVSDIQHKVIKLKPDIILLENYEDDVELYKIALPKTEILDLEDGVIFKEKDSLATQFRDRENCMLKNIKNVITNLHTSKSPVHICIVVGDTHLRTIETNELGKAILSLGLMTINNTIEQTMWIVHRSKYKEIE